MNTARGERPRDAARAFRLALEVEKPRFAAYFISGRNTMAPEPTLDPESLRLVVSTGRPTVTNLTRRPDGSWAFAVRVPVAKGGQVRWVLSAVMAPDVVREIVKEASDLTTFEVASEFHRRTGRRVSRSAMSRTLQKLGLTRKKSR